MSLSCPPYTVDYLVCQLLKKDETTTLGEFRRAMGYAEYKTSSTLTLTIQMNFSQ
jgi:hypothetical protein